MFPRIKKSTKKSGTYEYLVLSESVRDRAGRSTTKDVANPGNITNFDKAAIRNPIDGLIRLFEIEEYGLADQVEILKMSEKSAATRPFWKATTVTGEQQRHFSMVGVRNPASLDDYVWWRKRKHHLS